MATTTVRVGLVAALLTVTVTASGVRGAGAGCPPTPARACRVALRGTIDVRYDPAAPGKSMIRWKWSKGEATLLPGFGDPARTTVESLCLYDANRLVLEATLPPLSVCDGGACWRTRPGNDHTFKDGDGSYDGVRRLIMRASAAPKASIKLDAKGAGVPAADFPLVPPVTMQLVPSENGACFESTFGVEAVKAASATRFKASLRFPPPSTVPPIPSSGCGSATTYATGVNTDTLVHDGATRTFGVYLPSAYDRAGGAPAATMLALHGGFGSGEQVFTSSRLQNLADEAGVIVVYPDGLGAVRSWNAGRCCGYASNNDVDDVGFVAALLDHLDARLCVDDARVYATGMSNGAMLTYRLACELSARIAAIAPVAGSDMTESCAPTRPVPVMHVHGTDDGNVPWDGGLGCGPSGASFTSVAHSIGGWVTRDACTGGTVTYLDEGDGHCDRYGTCPSGAAVILCAIDGGGHTWPGGVPPASPGFPDCPFGGQSTTFDATRRLFDFFVAHPR
jgi:polyhydroxybutyrate depolymerase